MSVTVLSVCDLCPALGPVYPHPDGFYRVCRECWEKAAAKLDAIEPEPRTVCPACEGSGANCPHCGGRGG